MSWILYGAGGTTGSLVAQTAVRRGHRPLLAGRSAATLRPLAERLGLPWRAVSLEDRANLTRLAADGGLVLLAAAPFARTSAALLDACLDAGAHYVDLSNEVDVAERVLAADAAARAAGVTVLPGAGFGSVAADTLARHVVDLAPSATRLDITLHPATAGTSPAAGATRLAALSQGALVRRGGRLVRVRLGSGARRVLTPDGMATVMPVAVGELTTVHHTTGVPDVTVSVAVPGAPVVARLLGPVLGAAAGSRALQARAAARPRTALPAFDAARRGYVSVTARTDPDEAFTAWLETGEGYAFTAESAVRAVEAVLAAPVPGAHSPGRLLGADAVLDVPGVRRLSPAAAVS